MQNNTLAPEVLLELKKNLQKKKEQLETQLGSFATKDPHLKDDWDTKYPRVPEGNIEEAADEVEEYSTRLHIEYSLENQLKGVNDALARMEKGNYGVCATCGSSIASERLQASPEARLCQNCNKS